MRRSKSISATDLKRNLSSNSPSLVFDVRKKPAYDSDPRMIGGAVWRAHDQVRQWASQIPKGSKVVVYCVHGHEVSQSVATTLSEMGYDSAYLEGGIAEWMDNSR